MSFSMKNLLLIIPFLFILVSCNSTNSYESKYEGYSIVVENPKPTEPIIEDLGSPKDNYNLGVDYLHGITRPANDKKAFLYIQLAAKQYFHPAYFVLGNIYTRGTGVEKNNYIAYAWYSAYKYDYRFNIKSFKNTFYSGDDKLKEEWKVHEFRVDNNMYHRLKEISDTKRAQELAEEYVRLYSEKH